MNCPDWTGESMSRSKATGANEMVLADRLLTGRAVLNFQSLGRVRVGRKVSSEAGHPFGYRTTWFHIRMNRLAAPEALKSIAGPGAEIKKSSEPSTEDTPSGATRWNAYISTSSCCQGISFPPETNLSPARFQMGPSGEWSAGIHFG